MSNLNLIKDLQESYQIEALQDGSYEEPDKYRNQPSGEFLNEMDMLATLNVSLESLGETVRGVACFDQDLAVATGNEIAFEDDFSIENIVEEKKAQYADAQKMGTIFEFFSTEAALANKIKRAGYAAKINGKELVQKLLTWIKGIWDQYFVADGKLKSYKKLIKKYREKLNTTTPRTESDKEISVRRTDYNSYLTTYLNAMPLKTGNNAVSTTAIKAATDLNGLLTALIAQVANIIKSGVPTTVTSGAGISTSELTSANAEAISDIVKDKTLVENIKDYLDEIKDDQEAEEMTPSEAQSYLSQQAARVENALVDRKYKKVIDQVVKAANDKMKRLNKDRNATINDTAVEASQKISAIGALVVQYRTHVLAPWTKQMMSLLQALLADMSKVIAFNTKMVK